MTSKSQHTLNEYEDYAAAALAQLELVYRYSGGDETRRITAFLLRQIHKRTSWLLHLVTQMKPYEREGLFAPIEEIFAKIVPTSGPGGEDGNEKEKA